MKVKRQVCLTVMLVTLIFTGCGSQKVQQEEVQNQAEGCQLTFFDTGKSDCILIEMDDLVVINDTADEDDYLLIDKTLKEKQIEQIDYMIISHFDKDHIGSAAGIINNYEVSCVLMPNYWEDSDEYRSMMKAIQNKGIAKKIPDNEYEITTDNGSIVVNAPHESSYEDDNNYSLITTVTYEEQSVLLMGDALKNRTEEFLNDIPPQEGQYALIKTPHHGDYNKKLKDLFGTVKPKYAVITDNEQEKRVEDKLLNLLEKNECETLFTNKGNIYVNISDTGISVHQ